MRQLLFVQNLENLKRPWWLHYSILRCRDSSWLAVCFRIEIWMSTCCAAARVTAALCGITANVLLRVWDIHQNFPWGAAQLSEWDTATKKSQRGEKKQITVKSTACFHVWGKGINRHFSVLFYMDCNERADTLSTLYPWDLDKAFVEGMFQFKPFVRVKKAKSATNLLQDVRRNVFRQMGAMS